MPEVKLEWYEVLQAAMSGVMKRISSIRAGTSDDYGWGGDHQGDAWTREIEGAAAEIAYAKFRNQYWSASVDKVGSPDVGKRVQVRCCPFRGKNLLIRPRDSDEDIFVLVVGRSPVFQIQGWIKGRDGKREEWKRSPNGGSPVYLVDPRVLKGFCDKCRNPIVENHDCKRVG